MARTLTQIGIETGNVVEAYHVSQSIDAFTGVEAYNISLSGSFNMTGPINGQPGVINPLTASYAMNAGHAITASYAENAGGSGEPAFPFTGSAQITGSLGLTGSFGINNSIRFVNSDSDLGSIVNYNPVFVRSDGTPNIGRLFIGDSTGWQFHFSRRTSSITTDLISITDTGVIKLANENGSSFLFKVTNTSAAGTVIYTSRTDDSQGGSLRSDGWGNFSFNRSLAIGKEVEGGTDAVRLDVNGNVRVTGSITTPSYITNIMNVTYANNAGNASYATNAGYANNAGDASTAQFAFSAATDTEIEQMTADNLTLSSGRHTIVLVTRTANGTSTITLPTGMIGDVVEIIDRTYSLLNRNIKISPPSNYSLRAWGVTHPQNHKIQTYLSTTDNPTLKFVRSAPNAWDLVYFINNTLVTDPSSNITSQYTITSS